MFGAWLGNALRAGDDEHGVTLASIHAVKGQEWRHVVVHHVSAGLLPHRLVDDEEEERRVLHVGLTRGRRTVTVVPGPQPSPFLAELATPGEPKPRARPAPAAAAPASSKPAADGPAEALAAVPGAAFQHGGYDHEVVEVADGGARTTVGGTGTLTVPFGTTVRTAAGPRMLAHPGHEAAFERLRAWRATKAVGKPAYTVFADATLRVLAATLPVDEAGLRAVKGVGPTKLELYGEELLALTSELRSNWV